MLIVCTQDPTIRQTAMDPGSGAAAWGNVALLPLGPQPNANQQFAGALTALGVNEALCLSAHGNDNELGDEQASGWGWTDAAVANLLVAHVNAGWSGPILIHACAENISNFSAHLAVALEGHQQFRGLWCYGFNRGVPSDDGYPDPGQLASRVDLQGTQVNWMAAAPA